MKRAFFFVYLFVLGIPFKKKYSQLLPLAQGISLTTGSMPSRWLRIIASSLELVEMKYSQDKVEDNRPSVNISCHTEENFPKAFGSDAQIRDCIFNLVDNSYDAAYKKDEEIKRKDPEFNWPQGQPYLPQIEIRAFTRDNRIIITVTDNGIGVKEEDKKRLFAGYFTTKATGVKGYGKGGGHGIGLFTVKKLIPYRRHWHGPLRYQRVYFLASGLYLGRIRRRRKGVSKLSTLVGSKKVRK